MNRQDYNSRMMLKQYRPIVRLVNFMIILMGVGVLFSVISLVTFLVRTITNQELQFYSSYFLAEAFFRLFLLVLLTSGLVSLRRYVFQFLQQQEQFVLLKEKEDRLASAVSGAYEGLWDWDIKSGHVFYSERYKELLGYETLPHGETVETFNALLHPEDKDGVWEAVDRHFKDRELFSERYRLKTSSGEYRWFYSRGFAEYDSEGEAVRMSGLIHDVTSQVNLESALSEASRQVKGVTTGEIFESIADYLSRTLDVRFVVLSRVYEEAPKEAHLLAYKVGDEFVEPFSYELEGTPCLNVWRGKFCLYSGGVQEEFPQDLHLVEVGAESYAGVPLVDSRGKVIGLLAVIDTKPFEDEEHVEMMLDLFATRASSTLERHIIEQKLADSSQRSQRIFELGLVGMAISTKSKSFLEVNDRFCEMLGYSREEFETLTWQGITHEDDIELSRVMFEKLLSGEVESYKVDKRYIHCDGHVIHVQLAVKGVLDEKGDVDYFVALIDDVTDEMEALHKLKDNEARYRGYFEMGLVGMAVSDTNRQWIEVNDRICEMLGYSREEMLGMNWEELSHPDEKRQNEALFKQALNGEIDRYSLEKKYRTKDGRLIHVFVSAAAVRDERGEVEYFVTAIQDITERIREDERRQRMINELDHRVKNNLASVLSLANLSIQASGSLEAFEENFTGRVLALASAHEQLAARQWDNVPLSEMIVQTLSPYVGDNISVNEQDAGDVKVKLVGPDIMLQSKQTSALSLAVHELVTNALKYGALSEANGRMGIEWGVEGDQLNIDWVESELSKVDLESESGVGLNITRGMIEFELNGEFEIQFSNHSVRVGMRIPLDGDGEEENAPDEVTPVLNDTFEKLTPLVKKN